MQAVSRQRWQTVMATVAARMPSRLAAALITALLFVLVVPIGAALTEGRRLSTAYDLIFDARFDAADDQLTKSCSPAPAEACQVLRVMSLWWQIQLDPEARELDRRFEREAKAAIAATEAWTRREPRRAESWFYLAGAHAPLVQWRVLREQKLAAAREGNTIRQSLERTLELDPTLQDAYFGIGLYHYYADVAPTVLKMVRWLLLLPGGDKAKGLREMLAARDRGELVRSEAAYQMHWLYLWYENQPAQGLELVQELERQYPFNPIFLRRVANIQCEYFHDHPGSLASWQALLDRARARRVAMPELTEGRARLGLASEYLDLFEADRAIATLNPLVDAHARRPHGAEAYGHLLLGRAFDRLGDRPRAVAEYRAAIATAPGDSANLHDQAHAGLRKEPDRRAADAYRMSLEGIRAFEQGDPARAANSLSQAARQAPDDAVTRQRYGHVLLARGALDDARIQLEPVIDARATAPPFALAAAYVDLASISERSNDRARAIDLYQRAINITGARAQSRDHARTALARLTR